MRLSDVTRAQAVRYLEISEILRAAEALVDASEDAYLAATATQEETIEIPLALYRALRAQVIVNGVGG